jgi:hypothetical protein
VVTLLTSNEKLAKVPGNVLLKRGSVEGILKGCQMVISLKLF